MEAYSNGDDQNDTVLSPPLKEEAACVIANYQNDVILSHPPKEEAAGIDDDDQKDVLALSPLIKEGTAADKRHRFTSTAKTLLMLPSSSYHSVHAPPLLSSSDHSIHTLLLPSLPIELIVEILWRLPVKSLVQFQSVCKSWKSLISNPQFAKKQFHGRSSTTTNLILNFTNPPCDYRDRVLAYPLCSVFNDAASSLVRVRYPFSNQDRFDLIVGSCHGILCYHIDQNHSFLWNPSTGKYKNLPSLEYQWQVGSYVRYGFGYDHFLDIYKVVAILCYECGNRPMSCYQCGSWRPADYKTEVKVHTVGTKSWRRIDDFPTGVPCNKPGKFVSGTLNWLVDAALSSSCVIVSLDLGKESYQEVLQPNYGVPVEIFTLEVLRDCLCILSHRYTVLEVWLMKEYGNRESWAKLFRIPCLGNPNYPIPYTRALCISEDDQVLLENNTKLVVYDSRNNNFKIPQIESIDDWMVPEVYIESLISPS